MGSEIRNSVVPTQPPSTAASSPASPHFALLRTAGSVQRCHKAAFLGFATQASSTGIIFQGLFPPVSHTQKKRKETLPTYSSIYKGSSHNLLLVNKVLIPLN